MPPSLIELPPARLWTPPRAPANERPQPGLLRGRCRMSLIEVPQHPRPWTFPGIPQRQPRQRARRCQRLWQPEKVAPLLVAPSIVQVAIGANEGTYGPASPVTASVSGTGAGNALIVIGVEIGVGVTWSTPTDGVNTYTQVSVHDGSGDPQGTCSISLATNIAGGSVTVSQAFTAGGGIARSSTSSRRVESTDSTCIQHCQQ